MDFSFLPKEFLEYRNHVGAYYFADGWKIMGEPNLHPMLQFYTLDDKNNMKVLLVHPMLCAPGQTVSKEFVEGFGLIVLRAHERCKQIPEFVGLSAAIVTNGQLSPDARSMALAAGITLRENTSAYDLLTEVTPFMTERERAHAAGEMKIPLPNKSGCLGMAAVIILTAGTCLHFFFFP